MEQELRQYLEAMESRMDQESRKHLDAMEVRMGNRMVTLLTDVKESLERQIENVASRFDAHGRPVDESYDCLVRESGRRAWQAYSGTWRVEQAGRKAR